MGTEGGYKIFDALNNKILFENYLKGGIGIIDIKKNSNVIALVGGGV